MTGATPDTPKIIEHAGHRHTVAEWSAKIGVSPGVLYGRLAMKWPVDQALRKERRAHPRRGNFHMLTATVNGVEMTMPMSQWAEARDIKLPTISQRIRRKWTPEQALELADPPPRTRKGR